MYFWFFWKTTQFEVIIWAHWPALGLATRILNERPCCYLGQLLFLTFVTNFRTKLPGSVFSSSFWIQTNFYWEALRVRARLSTSAVYWSILEKKYWVLDWVVMKKVPQNKLDGASLFFWNNYWKFKMLKWSFFVIFNFGISILVCKIYLPYHFSFKFNWT